MHCLAKLSNLIRCGLNIIMQLTKILPQYTTRAFPISYKTIYDYRKVFSSRPHHACLRILDVICFRKTHIEIVCNRLIPKMIKKSHNSTFNIGFFFRYSHAIHLYFKIKQKRNFIYFKIIHTH